MKKILFLIVFAALSSCGPKRLGCGPNRRCEVKTEVKSQKDTAQKNPETTISGFLILC
jgi:hypothetical protein